MPGSGTRRGHGRAGASHRRCCRSEGLRNCAVHRWQVSRVEGDRLVVPATAPEGDRQSRRQRRLAALGGEKSMTAKILVLAGRRSAALDPLAKAAGVTHKCLVPVRGEAMVGRVLRTAADAWPDAELFLSVDDFSAVAEEPDRKSTRLNSSH